MWGIGCDEDEVPLSVQRVGIAFNLKGQSHEGEPDDLYEEYDCLDTVDSIAGELGEYGFKTLYLEQDETFVQKLQAEKPDFVLNIAEGKGSLRSREAQVPCILESLGIPYSGSDGVSLSLTLDKFLTLKVLSASGVSVPAFRQFSCEEDLQFCRLLFEHNPAYIVKPRWEGSSKGIFPDSVVHGPEDMEAKIRRIWKRYREPALVEEFLPGDEITVGIMGNGHPRVLGMMRICPVIPSEKFLYSIDHKREWEQLIRYDGPEVLSSSLREVLSAEACRTFKALELRDLARIDFRIDREGQRRVIDVNPLPGLSPKYSDIVIMYRLNGGSYPDIIRGLLRESFTRNQIAWKWN
ncbi:MAG TPA: ATP-grasp domain-containing protein [Synergistales bacterium]|nr:ATP-grasp domain-containing protein [Synergistales bacterium]